MLFKQIIFLLLALSFVRSSFNLLTNIEHFKKDFLTLLRLRNQHHDVIQFHNVPLIPLEVPRPANRPGLAFQQTQFAVVPTVQPPLPSRPQPRPQPSPSPSPPPPPIPSFTSLPVIHVGGVDEKPVIFPDYGDFNEVLFREQTLTKNFHNKKIKI